MAKKSLNLELDYLPPMPRDRSAPIGCIGSGFVMADCHLVAYRKAGFNPVAIASRTPAHAQRIAEQHGLEAFDTYQEMLASGKVEVVDIAVPPDTQIEVIRNVLAYKKHVRGILAQKPLGANLQQAREIVALCKRAGVTLAVNQNMRFDHSIRALKCLLERDLLGEAVLATIDMRAIPHWMPWQQRQGWVTLRIMSIHHLDTFRYLFGDPVRVFASVRPDPRTAKKFEHSDGICLYILEYENGLRAMACDDVWTGPALEGAQADIGIKWRVEGLKGLAKGTIGWPDYPHPTPSTLDFTTTEQGNYWLSPRWKEVWFPDAFGGTMAELLIALENGEQPTISGLDNLKTMALVDACYLSVKEHRAVEIKELLGKGKH
ncbi:oxidoreductase domain protein [Pirellula staleyi DSM 6068]|uniref:Oxidoreductase domain protein n=1 Tax=Pirellula staleyi (strain ATCC 27377 / DSM 6068 / ICPB 4128) TaxID=530564 RepID=D2R159_PIRSD|nr:Gfo/Idh/MocA family oxidoreductase [Pirellula staleyi]ADB18544.1 oxidoreductase domain protein [Pirellula staleyi DSM 6068]